MANTSIYNAFERMWQHIQTALSNKIGKNTNNIGWVGVSELQINDEEGNGAYITPENGDGTLMFYGSGGDQAVRLQNIANPVNDRDAANKAYVDSKIGSGGSGAGGDYIVNNGDTPIYVGDSDTTCTKIGIDHITLQESEEVAVTITGACSDNVEEYLEIKGKSVNDVRINGVATPVENNDAANKRYIDNKFNNQAETWTFTLADGSTVTKRVVLG